MRFFSKRRFCNFSAHFLHSFRSSRSLSLSRQSSSVFHAKFNTHLSDDGLGGTDSPRLSRSDASKENFAKFMHIPVKRHNSSGRTNCAAETSVYDCNVLRAASSDAQERVGVLLLYLGGPETLNDPDIMRLPRLFHFLQRPLAQLISGFRAPKRKEGYAAIGNHHNGE